jgi:hypothetical protein
VIRITVIDADNAKNSAPYFAKALSPMNIFYSDVVNYEMPEIKDD